MTVHARGRAARYTQLAVALGIAVVASITTGVTMARAFANSVTYTGQGAIADGFGGYALQTELCGVANGAEVDGPYLLWVLTATGATKADITGAPGTSGTVAMTKFGNGTFKYVSAYASPGTLVPNKVVATYDGKAKNVQLVISHGCRPFSDGAWCSPGFWRNATAGAWAVVGKSPTDLFNNNVYDVWYGATFAANPTLATVLGDAPTYSGPPLAGTSGYALNAFNATGAFLTNLIPGYQFDFAVMQAGSDDACPIDHFGNFKN
jgi:hypothetical protein